MSRTANLPVLLLALCMTATAPAGDTTPKESGRDSADLERGRRFAAWKATLSDEQQAWETVLEQNLGGFYLPRYHNAKLAGRPTAWDYVEDDPNLPRVLLIGDSVSRGYTLPVRSALAGKANVHRAPENCGGTGNALRKLDVWLGEGNWDVIHFNFGIHDRSTKSDQYDQRLEQIVQRLEKTGAKLIWATTTPLPAESKKWNDAAIVRLNAAAAPVIQRHDVAIDDLYNYIKPTLSEHQNPDDCHFNAQGYERLGGRVAASILQALDDDDGSTRKGNR